MKTAVLILGLLQLSVKTQAYITHKYCLIQPQEQETELIPDDTTGAIFFDDFSTGLGDHWHGDVRSFTATGGRLYLAEQATAPVSLSTPSPRLRNTVWEAGVQVDGGLSTSNYIRFYLTSTHHALREPQYGYQLQIDGTEEGHIYRLWRQNDRTRLIIMQSAVIPNPDERFRARVRVTCDSNGYWQILTDENDLGTFAAVPNADGNTMVNDDFYTAGGYAGYFINFSPTRRQHFKLDYMLIKPLDPAADSMMPGEPQPNDVLINEILSNPKKGGVDFVEIYNYSDKTIDLQQITVASVNSNGLTGSRRTITDKPILLYPNEYKVLTTDPATLKQHYPNGDFNTFIETPTLPNFNNETGGVILYSDSQTIDSLFYTAAMHSPFITDHKGISLERRHFSEPSHAYGNFRSAAASAGGATPGYRNSHGMGEVIEETVYFTSKTFSPDNDGFEDQLEINYHFPESGFMASIDIYSDKGRLVKRLQRNQSMAVRGTITWDGLSDTNERLPIGIYVAVIDIYHEKGMRKVYRKSFVLAARL